MSAFETALVILNLLIAAIYAAILWVMVQQRRIMSEQMQAMQSHGKKVAEFIRQNAEGWERNGVVFEKVNWSVRQG